VSAELARHGHRALAPDLPCDDISAGWSEYADVTLQAIDGIAGDIILVGHSLAGGVIPLVSAAHSVQRLVFLCSFPPVPGRSLDEAISDQADVSDPRALAFRASRDSAGRYFWPSFHAARDAMYHDCVPEDARWAFSRLRPQAAKPFTERWPLSAWPDVRTTFVVCSEDRMGRAAALRHVAERRLGLGVIEMSGGHSPFLSRPAELVQVLLA
jgi:hypothetical protein